MARVKHAPYDVSGTGHEQELTTEDRDVERRAAGRAVGRVVAVVSGAVLVVLGGIAAARIEWGSGSLGEETTQVAGLEFGWEVAVAFLALGLLTMVVGGTALSGGLFVTGALLVVLGTIAIATADEWEGLALERAHGWVLVVAGLLVLAGAAVAAAAGSRRVRRRTVRVG